MKQFRIYVRWAGKQKWAIHSEYDIINDEKLASVDLLLSQKYINGVMLVDMKNLHLVPYQPSK